MKIITLIQTICIVLMLGSCTAMKAANVVDAINPLKEEKGIDATVQLGKTNNAVEKKALVNADIKTKSTKKNTQTIQAEKVEQVISDKDAPWLIIAFALALAAPNPFSYWRNKRATKKREETIDELRRENAGLYREIADRSERAAQPGGQA